ncbi:hypothetical protein [Devosia sp. 2618]|uniref:hypothetical protein n=1 Tax=Devosia sp. 2618 TaxID=3156454 RepID=UPI003390C339
MAKSKKGRKQKIAAETGIEKRMVDSPLRTTATYLHELDEKPAAQQPGRIEVNVKMATLIGGFSRVRNRTEAETMAAARFRGLYERAQLGGARAMDYEAVKVDSSGPSEEAVFEIGDQARREYMGAVQRLGMDASSIVEQIVVHDMSVRDLAKARGEGEGGAARERMTQRLKDAVADLSEHFGYAGTAPDRSRIRGQHFDMNSHEELSTVEPNKAA